jgi:hypothetical protein
MENLLSIELNENNLENDIDEENSYSNFIQTFIQIVSSFLLIVIIGRLSKYSSVERDDGAEYREIEVPKVARDPTPEIQKPIETVDPKIDNGWLSENLEPETPPNDPPKIEKIEKVSAKIVRRKCTSVDPSLLKSTKGNFIRTLNVEDREERYRYEIVPVDVDHVCVLSRFFCY